MELLRCRLTLGERFPTSALKGGCGTTWLLPIPLISRGQRRITIFDWRPPDPFCRPIEVPMRPRHLVSVAVIVCAIGAARASAHAQKATWGAGVTTFGGLLPLPVASAGLYAGRVLSETNVRVEAFVSGPLTTAQGQGCIYEDCDTRYIGVAGGLGATLTGAGGVNRNGSFYPLIGAGVYTSRWGGGSLSTASGSTPASKAEGPFGPYVTAGAGIPLSILGEGFRLELRATHMFNSDRSMSSIGITALRLW
jgi:hypothetical protein